jgi:hypothetical protein
VLIYPNVDVMVRPVFWKQGPGVPVFVHRAGMISQDGQGVQL